MVESNDMKLPSVEKMIEDLNNQDVTTIPEMPEVEDDESESEDMKMHSFILLDILKGITRVETKLDAMAKEDIMDDFKKVPGRTQNTNPTFDAILMDNIYQSY
jgi:hypothetical protein